MHKYDISVEREAMELARKAVELPEAEQLAWVLRCHGRFDVVEHVLRLLRSFDEDAEELGVSLAEAAPAPMRDVPLPALVDRFRIVDLLGAGAFSRVYRAIDEATGEPVALKVLHLSTESEEASIRFEREVEVLSSLQHPDIARFVDAGKAADATGTTRWIAIELIEGESFTEASRGRDARWLASTTARISRAIQYAHDAGVIHRDLKPSNVMITGDEDVKVLDFGVAAIRRMNDQQRLTTTGQVIGTIAYMSPEQVNGQPANTRSDQFSLASMLFEAVTGKLPHSDGAEGLLGLFSIASWDGLIDPALLRPLDPDLATILKRALDPDPAFRHVSAVALADDLDRWVQGKPIRTSRPGWRSRLNRFVRRNRRPVLGSVVVITVLAGALVMTTHSLAIAQHESTRAQTFGDQALLPVLIHQADELWPQLPSRVDAMARWLEKAHALEPRLAAAERSITQEDDLASFRQQAALLPEAVVTIGERHRLARTLKARTVDAYRDNWYAAAERVHADVRFDGCELKPQVGLVPLGPDPQSGLEEFAVLDWGSLPARNSSTGRLRLEDDFTPVLVLLPGGLTQLGTPYVSEADSFLPSGLKINNSVIADIGVREIRLDPFLIGKYEVTQGQWYEVMGMRPSEWAAGEINSGTDMTDRHPVETISYSEATAAAARIGCTLPTEAQWEFAAAPVERGFFWWPEVAHFDHPRENVTVNRHQQGLLAPWEEDNYPLHAPVGTFAPNPNGLFDVLGNVSERCLDDFKVAALLDHSMTLEPGTGRVLADGGGDFACRGAHYRTGFMDGTIAHRRGPPGPTRHAAMGVRFARTLDR